jgi:pSer/pThr/pTyr-binding forkhead associated (FHA) protein
MAKLVIQQSDGTTREVVLDRDRITIGRRGDHDVCLPFPAVSADHAEIVTVGTDSFLHDLGSTNGTVVNGERVTKHFLRNHDRIEIGRQQLVYLPNEAEMLEPVRRSIQDGIAAEASDEPEAAVAFMETRASDSATEQGAQLSPVDALLTDLMEMNTEASVAIDIPAPVSMVAPTQHAVVAEGTAAPYEGATAGAYVEVMSGPNAGQITPMTKSEFILGKAGAPVAAIRRVEEVYRLVPLNESRVPTLNGQSIAPDGTDLKFGDAMEISGVKLRFNRRY